jgi:hypothetical protein
VILVVAVLAVAASYKHHQVDMQRTAAVPVLDGVDLHLPADDDADDMR